MANALVIISILVLFGCICVAILLYTKKCSYKCIDNILTPSQPLACEQVCKIPKIILQTYSNPTRIPKKVESNFNKFAKGYERRVYSDSDAIQFLSQYFSVAVLNKFTTLKRGAHKADLLRYCLLYIYGGIYLDIKTELVQPIDEMFKDRTITTCLTKGARSTYQGIIAAPPCQPIFLHLIHLILSRSNSPRYHRFVKDFYAFIKMDVGRVEEGYLKGKMHDYMIFTEHVTRGSDNCHDGLDRYGVCSNITLNGRRIFKTRYADYPWN